MGRALPDFGTVLVAKVGVEEADENGLIVEASEFRVLAREDELWEKVQCVVGLDWAGLCSR